MKTFLVLSLFLNSSILAMEDSNATQEESCDKVILSEVEPYHQLSMDEMLKRMREKAIVSLAAYRAQADKDKA